MLYKQYSPKNTVLRLLHKDYCIKRERFLAEVPSLFLLRPSKEDADRQMAVCKERMQLGRLQRGCRWHRTGVVGKEDVVGQLTMMMPAAADKGS
jgi:hypothetical protein